MANPFDLPCAFDSSTTRQQRMSAEITCNQPQMPAFSPDSASNPMNNLPNMTQSAYFKTRFCARFMSGLCPKGSNCNFAHSIEELRRPFGNGDRMVAFPREDHRANGRLINSNTRVFVSERFCHGEEQKLQNYRICRKYYNGEICHYGARCSFAHVEPGSLQDNNSVSKSKSPCWKTRICHKWSISRDCPYGDHCTYAHGDAELRKVGGDLVELLVEKNVFVEAPSNHAPNLANHVLSKMTKTELRMTNSMLEARKQIRDLTMKNSRIYGDWIDEVV